jgi:hypothetical protein
MGIIVMLCWTLLVCQLFGTHHNSVVDSNPVFRLFTITMPMDDYLYLRPHVDRTRYHFSNTRVSSPIEQ